MSRPEPKNAQSLGRGSNTAVLYRPEMRALENLAEVGGRPLGEKWEPCPYEVVYVQGGLAVASIGIPLPSFYSREDLSYGLPYEAAEAVRWTFLAGASIGFGQRIKTRIREVCIKRTHEIEVYDCEPYECAKWRSMHEAVLDGPAVHLPTGPVPDTSGNNGGDGGR